MKNYLNHSFVRLWALVLVFALLLSGCGTDTTQGVGGSTEPAGQGTEETPEPAGQDTGEGWKPASPVNLIVPYAAGGGLDIMARTIAQYIDLDGQSMYITNIDGGGGSIGSMEAYQADNDGLTLLFQNIEPCAAGYISGTIPANLCEEMTWIACLAKDPVTISVAADSPYETLEDLIAAAKEDSGGISLAVTSSASLKSAALQLQRVIGAEFTYVPYNGSAKAIAAVLGGYENLLLCQLPELTAYADSGELRILAVESEERSEFAPDVPTFKELGYDDLFFASNRCAILPPDTNEEIARYYEGKLKKLFENKEFQSVIHDSLGYNMVFIGMDDIGDKVNEVFEWAEEFVPAAG